MGFTATVSVNGTKTVHELLVGAGYSGNRTARRLRIFNGSATAVFYHATDSGSTAPASPLTGLPIGTAATQQGATLELGTANDGATVDLGTTWLHTAGALNVILVVEGA